MAVFRARLCAPLVIVALWAGLVSVSIRALPVSMAVWTKVTWVAVGARIGAALLGADLPFSSPRAVTTSMLVRAQLLPTTVGASMLLAMFRASPPNWA